jgi:peptidoglycan/LPS O-acetylase OafA/YrhL
VKTRDENIFDFLRLFAALSVVVGHTVTFLDPGSFVWYVRFLDGVPLFFILSGFLVYNSYEKCVEKNRPTFHFYLNRFLRIAPGIYTYFFVATILLFAIGEINLNSLGNKSFLAWIISNLMLIPIYTPDILRSFGPDGVNGALWTIPVEFSFYLAIPIFYLIGKKFSFKTMLVILFMLSMVGQLLLWYFAPHQDEMLYKLYKSTNFIPYLIYFTLGIMWSKVWRKVSKSMFLFLATFVLYLIIRYIPVFQSILGPLWMTFYAIPLSYAVIWFGYNGPKKLNVFMKFGDLSFGVYIWHSLIINVIIYFQLNKFISHGYLNYITVIFSSLSLAVMSWHLIEKNALKLKPYSSNDKQSNKFIRKNQEAI